MYRLCSRLFLYRFCSEGVCLDDNLLFRESVIVILVLCLLLRTELDDLLELYGYLFGIFL